MITLYDGRLREGKLIVKDGLIAGLKAEKDDGKGLLTVPGFIDIHTHGGFMIDVGNMKSKEDCDKLSLFYASHGVTSNLLSVATDTKENTLFLMRLLGEATEKGVPGSRLLGIHLEGPFLSPEYKGAMIEELLLPADSALFDFYDDVSGHHVKYLTLAPEIEGALDLIKHVKERGGCKVSMGHSAASYETAMEAVSLGVDSATHTFNAMKLFHQHFPAISGAAMESDVYCEVIADGMHLHPGAIRILVKAKGEERIIAITDSLQAAGMPDGRYKLGVEDVVVKGADAKLLNGVRAGSVLTMDKAFKNLLAFSEKGVETVSKFVSENPARMLALENVGVLKEGYLADYAVLDKEFNVLETFVQGKQVFKA